MGVNQLESNNAIKTDLIVPNERIFRAVMMNWFRRNQRIIEFPLYKRYKAFITKCTRRVVIAWISNEPVRILSAIRMFRMGANEMSIPIWNGVSDSGSGQACSRLGVASCCLHKLVKH